MKSDKRQKKKLQNKNETKTKERKKKSHINWEESSRLKANSEVDTYGPFFLFLSLLFPYSFVFFFVFFPWVKGHSQNQTKHKIKNRFWSENTRLRLIANFNNYVTAMQFLFQIHLLILWANSCADVALRAGLAAPALEQPSRYPRLEPKSTIGHEVLSTRCFLIPKLFSFALHYN